MKPAKVGAATTACLSVLSVTERNTQVAFEMKTCIQLCFLLLVIRHLQKLDGHSSFVPVGYNEREKASNSLDTLGEP